jgi:hypothetical protein
VWHASPAPDGNTIGADPEEATVANKDKGSQKGEKKKAQHNLKEKRAAKKSKRGTSSSSTIGPS